jgi:lipoyl(octanoyl) transferase
LKNVIYKNIIGISYQNAWDLQTSIHKALIDLKMRRRDSEVEESIHQILFCEHFPPVYTLGKSGELSNLLLSEKQLEERNIDFFKINRGGDITFHGPGQITGYPILDMDFIYTDIHKYVRDLEQAIINTIAYFNIEGHRIDGYTGVWVKKESEEEQNRKICAIGVHLSRWVTMHGFALNVNTDLSYFDNIIPCGIADEDKSVTSISKEIGSLVNMEEVKSILLKELLNIFGLTQIEDLLG